MPFWSIMLGALLLMVVLLGFLTLNRYIGYKERVALARLGYSLDDLNRDAAKRYGNRGVLWGGVITAMSGLALLLGLATLGIGAWLLAGLLPLFVGLGMALVYFITLQPAEGVRDGGDMVPQPGVDPDLAQMIDEVAPDSSAEWEDDKEREAPASKS